MSDNQRNLERYLQKICEIQDSQQEKLNNSDLKQLAYDIGMSNDDWRNIQKTFDAHLTRGIGYYKYKNWDDAIDELEQAAAINPFHEQTLFTLSSSFACRYHEGERSSDKSMAKYYAKQCLELYPSNEQALQLISALRKEDFQRKITERESLRTLLVAASLGAIVFAGLAYLSWTTSSIATNNVGNKEIKSIQTSPVLQPVADASGTAVDVTDPAVNFIEDEKSDGLSFNLESSKFKDYGYDYSYTLKGNITIEDIDIENLKIKIELLDKDGNVRVSDVRNIIDEYSPTGRNGDVLPLYFLEFVKNQTMPDFSEVRISVQQINKKKSETAYAPSQPVDVDWGVVQPEGMDIEVNERLSSLSKSVYGKGFYHRVVLEVKNTGDKPINSMNFQLQWLDNAGEVITTNRLYVNTESGVKINTGETRVINGTWHIKDRSLKDLADYKVIVMESE